jgi:hypothetical protein
MESRLEPLTTRERRELQGYVAWSTGALRVLLFLLALAIFAAAAWRVHSWIGGRGPWWLVAPTLAGIALFFVAGRWTGGPEMRRRIRADLASGMARVTVVRATDAIAAEEAEDEGPTFFLRTEDGGSVVFAGQYLDRLAARGFPWRAIEIREGAESKTFFGLKPAGEALLPSAKRPPLSLAEARALGYGSERWQVLALGFDELRARLLARRAGL